MISIHISLQISLQVFEHDYDLHTYLIADLSPNTSAIFLMIFEQVPMQISEYSHDRYADLNTDLADLGTWQCSQCRSQNMVVFSVQISEHGHVFSADLRTWP